MNLNIDYSLLEAQLLKIGAVPVEVDLNTATMQTMDTLSIDLMRGIEIDIADVEINDASLLEYKGHQVVLYIPDHSFRVMDAIEDGSAGKRFHVSDCRTLHSMRESGRFERYAVRNGFSAEFIVHGESPDGEVIQDASADLCVCKNCLNNLNYKGYSDKGQAARNNIFKNFSLEEFFSTYSAHFSSKPSDSQSKFRPNQYSKEWERVSSQVREQAGWQCHKCNVNLNEHRSLLHAHHRNGLKSDNHSSNLMPLCIECHSNEPNHSHMGVNSSDLRTLRVLRRKQGVRPL